MRSRLLLLLGLLLGAAVHAATIEVTDDRGKLVRLDAAPQRVVSLLPSLTETVCALGQCARLVGVDSDSSWPSSIGRLPRLGEGLDPRIEAVLALRPDVVLMARSSPYVDKLEALGLKVIALEPQSHADVRRVLGQVAQVTGAGATRAAALWDRIESEIVDAARSLPADVHATRVYFEVDPAPYAAGPTSFVGETLARLGAGNVLPAALGTFPRVNPEFVVRSDPDLIMIGQRSASTLAGRPGWRAIRAIREHRICAFDAQQFELLTRPGPRLGEAARLMALCLRDKHEPARPAAVSRDR